MENFFVFAENSSKRANHLAEILRMLGKVTIIDCGSSADFPSRFSLIDIARNRGCRGGSTPAAGEAGWWISEDLAGDWMALTKLIDEMAYLDPDLAVFSLGDMTSPVGLARIRETLHQSSGDGRSPLERLLDDGGREFSDPGGPHVVEWAGLAGLRKLFNFPGDLAPMDGGLRGIHFPVSDDARHAAICNENIDLAERMGSRVSKYAGPRQRGWYLEDCERWIRWFGSPDKARILEVGRGDSIGTNAILDLIFPHPESEIHVISPLDEAGPSPDAETIDVFGKNAVVGGHVSQINLYEGEAAEILSWMIAEEGFWESFDFAHIRASNNQVLAMSVSCQTWFLLKPGGVMVLDALSQRIGDLHPSHSAFKSFRTLVGAEADLWLQGGLTVLRKRPALLKPESKTVPV